MNNFEQLPLRDIHLPELVSWWPPALGWWLLFIVLVLAVFLVWGGLKRFAVYRQQRALRHSVEVELNRIEAEYKSTTNANRLLQDLSILLRRVVMTNYPRKDVAGLCGKRWEGWLRDSAIGKGLSEQSIQLLVDGPYKKDIAVDAGRLLPACREWVESVIRSPQRAG